MADVASDIAAPQRRSDRVRLGTKFAVVIGALVLLSIAGSVFTLILARQLLGTVQTLARVNVDNIRAAEELEIALLEQRGFVSSYLLDKGNRIWLDQLREKEHSFRRWLAAAYETAHTARQREILSEVQRTYVGYSAKRRHAVELYDQGSEEEAVRVLLEDVPVIFLRAYQACEDFITANDEQISLEMNQADAQTNRVTWLVLLSAVVTSGAGLGLLGLFHFVILVPLRRMASDARNISDDGTSTLLPAGNELRAVGHYLETLMEDVTQTRAQLETSEARLVHAEKLASVGKLAASVAHEIRKPLTAMKIWLFSACQSAGEDHELSHKLHIVRDEISRLEKIVTNVLEFSRRPEVRVAPHRLCQLIDKTAELLAERLESSHIELVRYDQSELPLVLVDPDQFKQVLINLIQNSLEAMEHGGRIVISSTLVPASGASNPASPMVVLRVADEGQGMPVDVCSRIFEPFFTTKERGTGLGLCIAASVMARLGGRIILESSAPGGTVFSVWIPAGTEGPK